MSDQNNTPTPRHPFAAVRDIQAIEDRLEAFGKQLDRALDRMEAVSAQLAEGATKFATQKLELEHMREQVLDLKTRVKVLEEAAVTREHIETEIRPVAASVLKLEESQTWLIRLIGGSLVGAILSAIGIAAVAG